MDDSKDHTIPSRIKRVRDGITISWRDGHESLFTYELLRRRCQCAGCRAQPPKVVTENDPFRLVGEVPIYADSAELVGNYAVQFFWNDGHSSGIYPYTFLRGICPCTECTPEAVE